MDYLERYASFFQLKDGIHLNTEVNGAKLKANNMWEVQAEKDGQKIVMTADRLIVATGSNHTHNGVPTTYTWIYWRSCSFCRLEEQQVIPWEAGYDNW